MQRAPAWIARNERVAVDIAATVFRDDHPATAVRITDLSFEGCGLSGEARFAIGERVRVYIPRQGSIEAEIRWSLDDRAGARFLSECASPLNR